MPSLLNSAQNGLKAATGYLSTTNAASDGWLLYAVYAVLALVAVYYLYAWLAAPAESMESVAKFAAATRVTATSDNTATLTTRLREGGDFTLSMWLFVEGAGTTANKPRHVFTLANSKLPAGRAAAVGVLYPNQPHLMLRFYTGAAGGSTSSPDYTDGTALTTLLNSDGAALPAAMDFPLCDVHDLDLQRWTLVTAVVTGRVADVYVDGKLSRSCVLPGTVKLDAAGTNSLRFGAFGGQVSGVRVYDAALTPDRVWALYAAGPRVDGAVTDSIAGYLASKMGIQLSYLGSGGAQQTVG